MTSSVQKAVQSASCCRRERGGLARAGLPKLARTALLAHLASPVGFRRARRDYYVLPPPTCSLAKQVVRRRRVAGAGSSLSPRHGSLSFARSLSSSALATSAAHTASSTAPALPLQHRHASAPRPSPSCPPPLPTSARLSPSRPPCPPPSNHHSPPPRPSATRKTPPPTSPGAPPPSRTPPSTGSRSSAPSRSLRLGETRVRCRFRSRGLEVVRRRRLTGLHCADANAHVKYARPSSSSLSSSALPPLPPRALPDTPPPFLRAQQRRAAPMV